MKLVLESKTLADARKELYRLLDRMPYKVVMGRRYTNEEKTEMELCYYAFETKEDHEEWLAHAREEKQLTGPVILRHANKNQDVKYWFEDYDKLSIIKLLQKLYGCSAETARWVHKNLATIYGKKTIRINE